MAQYLSEHLSIPLEQLLRQAGIDVDEFNDKEAFDILNIKLPPPPGEDEDEDDNNHKMFKEEPIEIIPEQLEDEENDPF